MSHLVLARKYRPDTFQSVSGQEHVTKTLSNAITRDQVGHAYLFAGPRGVGKTSIARIFAKCLNCAEGPTVAPCGMCSNCKEIASGSSLAVREIDGASHNSVDNVRELIESFRTLPAPGSTYKVYIIDEVHMLSLSAFNALLKSLEEPPPHTVFLLATTEPHKIPDTVLSRCQQHDLRALPMKTISQRLGQIAADEKLTIEPQALKMIAKLAEGSMRDAQTLLERVRSYTDDVITGQEVSVILGTVNLEVLFQMARNVFSQDASAVLRDVEKVFETGADETVFLRGLVTFFRDLFVVKVCEESDAESFGISPDEYREMSELVVSLDSGDLSDLADMARVGADKALRSSFPRYALESLLVKMALRPPVRDIGAMVSRLREMVGSNGGVASQKKKLKKSPTQSEESRSPLETHTAAAAPQVLSNEMSPISQLPKEQVAETLAVPVVSQPSSVTPAEVSQRMPEASQQVPSLDENASSSLSVSDFVHFVSDNKQFMIAENLKRVSVEKFSDGVFTY